MTTISQNTERLLGILAEAETNPRRDALCRRVLRDERLALMAAIQRGDTAHVAAVEAEARRVATMWGVALR